MNLNTHKKIIVSPVKHEYFPFERFALFKFQNWGFDWFHAMKMGALLHDLIVYPMHVEKFKGGSLQLQKICTCMQCMELVLLIKATQ